MFTSVTPAQTPTMPTFPTSWYSPSYQGEMIAAGSEILLKGQSYFQNDGGFVRSAFLSATGGMSTFGDFDGIFSMGIYPTFYFRCFSRFSIFKLYY